jgi:hypothetical protein
MNPFRSAGRLIVAMLLPAAVAFAVIPDARAETLQQRLEAALTKAMTANRADASRMLPSGAAIKLFIKNGFVKRKPEARQDYSDYRLLRKPFTFMGHSVVALEEQNLVEYIGCCVDDGIGALLVLDGSADALNVFASANGCTVSSDDYDIETSLNAVGLARDGRRYLYIYCGARGLAG